MIRSGPLFDEALHPPEVATIVGTMTAREETLPIAVPHDTVEDAGATPPNEIAQRFGARVAGR